MALPLLVDCCHRSDIKSLSLSVNIVAGYAAICREKLAVAYLFLLEFYYDTIAIRQKV